jgi:hypothetical protein
MEPTGIASANASSTSIYVDAANQLIVRSSELGNNVKVNVYDALGKNVFQTEINNQNSQFDMSSYTKGIYFVKLQTAGKMITQKIILSK